MKLKKCFPGILLPFRKEIVSPQEGTKTQNKSELFFQIALIFIWLLVFLFSFLKVRANDPVLIGHQVPKSPVNNLINYPSAKVNLSDFNGKLLILDFWDTWCGACIESMPELALLRDKYQGRVQFISVNTNKLQVVKKFLRDRNDIASLHLTMSLSDSVLCKLFPHQLVPHVVWISPRGEYLGATTQADLNTRQIDRILESGKPDFTDPKKDIMSVDYDRPLFVKGNGGTPAYLYKNLISRFQPGLASQSGVTNELGKSRIYITNDDLYNLFLTALAVSPIVIPVNRVVYDKPGLEQIFRTGTMDRNKKLLFTYQRTGDQSVNTGLRALMLKDLNDFFGIKVSLEKRLVDCIVIKDLTVDRTALLAAKRNVRDTNASMLELKKLPVAGITERLNLIPGMPPTIVETQSNKIVPIQLSDKLKSHFELNRWLIPNGFIAKEEPREVLMMVVTSTSLSPILTNR